MYSDFLSYVYRNKFTDLAVVIFTVFSSIFNFSIFTFFYV